MQQKKETHNPVTKNQAILLVLSILSIISTSLLVLKVEPHVPIFLSLVLLILFSLTTKRSWKFIEKSIITGLNAGLIPIFLFILIGMLIAVWMLSGTIPTFIYFGSLVVSEKFFLPSVFVVTAIVGSFLGSAFTTASTVGLAFMAIGITLGINPAIVAGAIISGAFLGDKMSPLSDTTNIAAAVCKVDLFEHIKHMLWTTVPAFIICLIAFTFMSKGSLNVTDNNLRELSITLKELGLVNPMSIIPVLIMFVLAWKRTPTVLVLLTGIFTGLLVTFINQHSISISEVMGTMQNGFIANTGDESLDRMLSRGGIQSMMWSISLVFLTLMMGGVIKALKIMERIMELIVRMITTTGRLFAATAFTAIGVNITIGEQYMSIILTGNTFEKEFENRGISRKNLARILEDAGTVINPLIPYGVSGVFMASVLGVGVLEYLPFALFCLVSPILTVFYGFTGISVKKG